MKNNNSFFSCFSLLIIIYLIGAHSCFANTYKDEVNGVTYSYSVGGGEASVSFVQRGRETIHILASFQATDNVGGENKTFSYKVTSIPQNLFRYNTDLITVTGMENIKSIGYGAFYSCTSLTSVGDLSKLTSIGEFAFHFCSNLAGELNLENVSYIPRYTFTNCESLTKVGDLCMCTSIGEGAFSNCYSLTSVGDLSNCKSNGGHAFFIVPLWLI